MSRTSLVMWQESYLSESYRLSIKSKFRNLSRSDGFHRGVIVQHVEPEVPLAAVAKCLAERYYMVSAFLLKMT
jgi:hypothetical protein